MEIRNITYYKTIKPLIFNDGFEVPVGTKVQFNFSEGQIFNVEFTKNNEKRIFWVHSSELTLYKTIKEKWLKKNIEEHNIDLNDKWFEYEKQRIAQSKDKKGHTGNSGTDTKRKSKSSERKTTEEVGRKRTKSEPSSKSSDKPNKPGNKTGISVKKGKKVVTKKATKSKKSK